MGTDAGTPCNLHGENARELHYMVECGMKPLDALRAGTSLAADLVDLPAYGLLRTGQIADLLLVDGNPAEDSAKPADRKNPRALFSRGPAGNPVLAGGLSAAAQGVPGLSKAARQRD